MGREKQYWLLKTEPGEWSWDDQATNGGISEWDGVKNKQAQKNLKAMKFNDLCFFYHSGAKARRVVGAVTVVREWYEVGGEGVVDVKAVGEMRRPLDLKELKGDEGLKGFQLFRQPRLSVVPVSKEIWERVCELGGGFEGDGKEDGGGDDDGIRAFALDFTEKEVNIVMEAGAIAICLGVEAATMATFDNNAYSSTLPLLYRISQI
ncbi:hypothetical protein SADUNF_Sadunf09G0068700 [Salix dunnii]|uniref:EVE domain-containing protein n=1 Tax=Salix dunnii TaxID=1413687 RepID=A0A835JVV9_9ROSI|nr:hypothetical protein SADUNF_Sadunf09G0068700 [Salix dunnii]